MAINKDNLTTTTSTSGLGFLGGLQLLFIALKLCGVINWSWFWVLAPIWIPIALVLAILVIGLISVLIYWLVTKDKKVE